MDPSGDGPRTRDTNPATPPALAMAFFLSAGLQNQSMEKQALAMAFCLSAGLQVSVQARLSFCFSTTKVFYCLILAN